MGAVDQHGVHRLDGPGRRRRLAVIAGRHRVGAAIAVAVVLLIASPALFRESDFGPDYFNHWWLIAYQGHSIRSTGLPTLFVSSGASISTQGVFDPYFLFYGGSLYALGGYLTVALGNAHVAYVLLIVVGLVMAYGGTWWLSRLADLDGWKAHVPAIVALTSPYLLTDVYARGAWTEFMALSAIPLVVAGVIATMSTDRWLVRHFLLLWTATAFLTGSHNITLLWGSVLLAVLAVGMTLICGRSVLSGRLVRVVATLLLGIGINAWFLVGDITKASQTIAANTPFSWALTSGFNSFWYLLDPLRSTPPVSTTPGLTVAAPVLALAWAVCVAISRWGTASYRDRALWLLFLGLVVGLMFCVVTPEFWSTVGSPLDELQFPYRLNGYVVFLSAALVLVALRMRPGPRWSASLLVVVALSVVPACWQEWSLSTTGTSAASVDVPLDSRSTYWYDGGSYADSSERVVATTRLALLPTLSAGTTVFDGDVTVPAGRGPVALNVEAGPWLVDVVGARRLGRTLAGRVVVFAPDSDRPTRLHLRVSQARPAMLSVGLALTIGSAVAVVVGCAVLSIGRWRPRRSGRPVGPDPMAPLP